MIRGWEQFLSKVPLTFNRRQMLQSIFASTAFVVGMGAKSPYAIKPAQAGEKLDRAFMLRMAKDIYPHDGFLDDKPYLDVVDGVIKEASTDEAVSKLIQDGLSDLNARSKKIHGTDYVAVPSYGAREALLRSIELSPFFQKIRGGLLFGLYNNVALFPKFGYGGSSWEQGGYIDRGFSDIDWLPQDPRKEGGKN